MHDMARRGYLTTQVAGGVWADKFGGKTVLGFGVIWWSIATVMTPLAASLGLPALLLARACMGVGEGVAMPAMNNLLSRCATRGQVDICGVAQFMLDALTLDAPVWF